MPRSTSGGPLISEIGVGGKGGRNIVADENQNWWSSKMPVLEPTTITSTIETYSQLNINHVIDYTNILSKLLQENLYCKSCLHQIGNKSCPSNSNMKHFYQQCSQQ